jgi:hypothetical protein
MKKFILVLAGLVISSTTFAAPPTFAEGGLIFGGENGRNSGGKQNGIEATGSWGINENWYIGGTLGYYDRKDCCENSYVNFNGGYAMRLNDKTTLNFEGGLWFGEEKLTSGPNEGDKSKPSALEAKVGMNHMLTEKFGLFGTFSLVGADLDTDDSDEDDLSNFIWSLGGAYAFTDVFSLNVKLVNGVNGVNGQDEVLRVGARWTF